MHGARVVAADSAAGGLEALAREQVDLVIQDMNFRREATSGEEGIALFRRIREQHPELPVILLTAWTHLETAVELVKAGAADYVAKPWDNARLLTTVRNLLDLHAARAENRAIRRRRALARSELAARFDLKGLVYESEAMHALASTAARVAHADVPVLITGPNGAGKEVIADVVQANSTVKGGPYVKVNVGALPDTLMESELFGTEAGAFTGAKARIGRFEAADGGTIFLDELGNLSAQGQAKLLRVLQTGEYERLGSNTTRRTRARVIAATNSSLPQLIREGRFREDLLYRLNVIELEVPDARRAPGRHRPARAALPRAGLHALAGRAARARALPLAGQRARAAERDPPGLPAVGGERRHGQGARAARRRRARRRLAHRPRGDRAGAARGRRGRGARGARPRAVAPGTLSPHGEARPQGARRPGPHDRERLTPLDLAR